MMFSNHSSYARKFLITQQKEQGDDILLVSSSEVLIASLETQWEGGGR